METREQRGEQRDGRFRINRRLPSPSGDILLEIKRTSAAVELRGVLLSLAYLLTEEPPSSRAVCVLTDTRLTKERVQEEITRFQEAVNPALARRVFLVAIKDGAIHGEMLPIDTSLLPMIIESAQRESANPAGRVSQQAVKTAALSRWHITSGRLGVADMQRATGASMPTVIAAFRAMQQDGLVYPVGTGWHLVDELPWDSVQRMVEAHAAERRVIRFKDPTGHARSPLAMAERLRKLLSAGESADVGLGGVLGSLQYYPDLDITGAPRLDLCVYDGDAGFVRKIDAGLIETSDPADKAALVLHLTRDPRRGPRPPGELHPASVVDCLADLLEIGLQSEARDFWHAMSHRRQDVLKQETQG